MPKTINLYPKPHAGQPTREIAVSTSAIQFTGDSAELVIGDETNYITYSSVLKNDAANGISVAYVLADDPTTTVSVAGQAITVGLGYQPLTASSYSTNLTGSNNDLTFTAVTAGADGDDITIAYIDPSANSATLSVDVTDTDIVVNLATNGSGAITSTANQVKAAIQAKAEAAALVSVALKTGNTGAGVVTALAETNLAGGYDAEIVATLSDIKTAIEANAEADALVSLVITGTDSTLAEVAAAAFLTGGAEAFDIESSYVLINVKAHSVYVTFDESTPASNNGVVLPEGYLEIWSSHAARAALFLKKSGDARVVGVPLCD